MSTDWKQIAIGLIKQLPEDHEGRNTFLMNNSNCDEAKKFKVKNILSNTSTSLEEKVAAIEEVYVIRDTCSPAPHVPPGYQRLPTDNSGNRW